VVTARDPQGGSSRGQAFTLEGLVAALVVVAALAMSLQAVVVTPTTRGTVDEDVRTGLRQQATDTLSLAAAEEPADLSYLVRNWEPNGQTFAGAENPQIGYGMAGPPLLLGRLLNTTFTQRGYLYNVEVRYRTEDPGRDGRLTMVRQGVPDENAVVAAHAVTLYDNETLTSPGAGGAELWEYDTTLADGDGGYYPIPDVVDGPIYNRVEVRVVVW
jgi:hypothetical protein